MNPYANNAHRPGCGCRVCQPDTAVPDVAVACRRCGWWKRRDAQVGACWHDSHHGRETFQGASCPSFTPRTIVVVPTPPAIDADLGQAFDF